MYGEVREEQDEDNEAEGVEADYDHRLSANVSMSCCQP